MLLEKGIANMENAIQEEESLNFPSTSTSTIVPASLSGVTDRVLMNIFEKNFQRSHKPGVFSAYTFGTYLQEPCLTSKEYPDPI